MSITFKEEVDLYKLVKRTRLNDNIIQYLCDTSCILLPLLCRIVAMKLYVFKECLRSRKQAVTVVTVVRLQ